jgi:pimeloyl-ACP methyl ester carboxylesterase
MIYSRPHYERQRRHVSSTKAKPRTKSAKPVQVQMKAHTGSTRTMLKPRTYRPYDPNRDPQKTLEQTRYSRRSVDLGELPHVIHPGDTQYLILRDGRTMGFSVYGSRNPSKHKVPLVCFHATPDSRLGSHFLQEWGEAHGIPIITVERPGYGISTCKQNYSVSDHAKDVYELIFAKLGYSKVRVEATSGGGPYALAFTSLCDRNMVAVTGIMCGTPPPGAPIDLINSGMVMIDNLVRISPALVSINSLPYSTKKTTARSVGSSYHAAADSVLP